MATITKSPNSQLNSQLNTQSDIELNSQVRPGDARTEEKYESIPSIISNSQPLTWLNHSNIPSNPPNEAYSKNGTKYTENVNGEGKLYCGDEKGSCLGSPLVISDNDGDNSEGMRLERSKRSEYTEKTDLVLSATQEIEKSIKEEREYEKSRQTNGIDQQNQMSRALGSRDIGMPRNRPSGFFVRAENPSQTLELSESRFISERKNIMKIVVKYVSMKIINSFPPPSARTSQTKEMPLDQFLMILVSRLQLTLTSFMKGIIYLFRYMDIIYLLRYVNQSNNFANYTDMGHEIKKLIVACYRLVLARERQTKDWSGITGLKNAQINDVVRTVVGRLNGKLSIKTGELIRLRGEILRYVSMVTKIA